MQKNSVFIPESIVLVTQIREDMLTLKGKLKTKRKRWIKERDACTSKKEYDELFKSCLASEKEREQVKEFFSYPYQRFGLEIDTLLIECLKHTDKELRAEAKALTQVLLRSNAISAGFCIHLLSKYFASNGALEFLEAQASHIKEFGANAVIVKELKRHLTTERNRYKTAVEDLIKARALPKGEFRDFKFERSFYRCIRRRRRINRLKRLLAAYSE